MRIFVGYGYNDRDAWIPQLVFPLLEAFGVDVVTGEDMAGEQLSAEVQRRIGQCDALIGFRTQRPNEPGHSHLWVENELAYAVGRVRKILEVREDGISTQPGMLGDRQWIPYREAQRDRLLVELAKAVGAWTSGLTMNLQVLPQECVAEIRPLLGTPGFRCTYSVLEGNRASQPHAAEIRPITGGLFVLVEDVPRQAFVSIQVEGEGKRWSSDYETLDGRSVQLNRS